MSTLVTFFSAEGKTAKVAKEFAKSIEADIFEMFTFDIKREIYPNYKKFWCPFIALGLYNTRHLKKEKQKKKDSG